MDPQTPYLQLTTDSVNGHQVITAIGEVDLCTSPALHDYLQDTATTIPGTATGDNGDLVLDLRALTFMNSSGLRVLLQADQRACRSGGRLRLVALTAPITRLLMLMRLDAHFDIYPTLTAATSPATTPPGTGDGARPQRTPREQPTPALTVGVAAPRQRRRSLREHRGLRSVPSLPGAPARHRPRLQRPRWAR
jgi:anti-anti-sigma factor